MVPFRLSDLQQLCIGWKGWVAAAVFSPFKQDTVALSSLADWHARLQQVGELDN